MNKVFEPGAPLAEPLQHMLLELRDTSRSHIVISVSSEAALRREAMAELAQGLSGKYALYEFDYVNTDQLSPMPPDILSAWGSTR